MRIGLTVKLLVILGLTSAVSVLAMGLAARWSFQHGFLDYLGQQELKRVAPLEEALVEAYEEHGSWDLFQRDPGVWPRFVDDALAPLHNSRPQSPGLAYDDAGERFEPEPGLPTRPLRDPSRPGPPNHGSVRAFPPPGGPPPALHQGQPFSPPGGSPLDANGVPPLSPPNAHPWGGSGFPPPPGPGFDPPPGRMGFGQPPPGPGSLAGRLHLLDDQRRIVAGGTGETGEELLITLESDGAVIGWLGLSPPLSLEDELAQRFYSQHNRSLLWISVSALTLAVLLGRVFGEGILRRVQAVAGGARRLAEGDYGARLAPKGRDELTALADDFNRLAGALERNEELRRRGMADVSHELRTPVAVARAELDALIDGIRPCTKERLEQIQGRLLDLARLLDDLYDLALSDAGALAYRHAPLDLGEILETAVGDSRAAFADKGIELRLESDEELLMIGDRGRLRQVLDNLLGNSLRYTDPGGFTRIEAMRIGDEIKVSVSDSPPGVTPEAMARLFDRFYRVEESRSRAKGGAGLGLAICRNIVEAHRGSISADSAEPGGLAIEIRLPASDS